MGSGASRAKTTPTVKSEPETTIVDRVIEALSPRLVLSPRLALSSSTAILGSPQKPKSREVQVRNRAYSDPLIRYEPPTMKKQDANSEITLATTSRLSGGDDGSNSAIQRNGSENSSQNKSGGKLDNRPTSSGAKFIFSSMHSLPSYLSSNQRNTNDTFRPTTLPNSQTNNHDNTNPPTSNNNTNATNFEFKRHPVDSIKLRERQYWVDGKNHAFTRGGSWNELQISSILSRPFSGNTITLPNKSKNKKSVRTVAVLSPRDQTK